MRRVSIRPWPFSTVSASRKSGGGSSEGGSVAEGGCNVVPERRLIVFDGEQVIAASLPDMPAQRALRENRVAGDNGAAAGPSAVPAPP